MPIDVADLQQTLLAAITEYNANPDKAVRSGGFISPLHSFCARELARHGLPAESLVPHQDGGGYLPARARHILDEAQRRVRYRLKGKQYDDVRDQLVGDLERIEHDTRRSRLRVSGGYIDKEIDVCLMAEDTGPLLAISVKSQMSSIAKNAVNRFEEYVGDATNLHARYPLLALGFLLIVPKTEETFHPDGQQTDLLGRIQALLEQATGRDTTGKPGSYEASALMVVDFDQPVPSIHPTVPAPESPLRIERFFDSLVQQYRMRNRPLV